MTFPPLTEEAVAREIVRLDALGHRGHARLRVGADLAGAAEEIHRNGTVLIPVVDESLPSGAWEVAVE